MTNKYSELSDFEINKLIADNLGYEYEIAVCFPEPQPQNVLDYQYINKKVTNNKKFWVHIDYCKHYNNAFKLMIDNKRDLDFNPLTNSWSCRKRTHKNYISSLNENPCRAIAETFLLMKNAENKDETKTL